MSSTHDAYTLHNRIVGLTAFLETFQSSQFTFATMDCTLALASEDSKR